jgi:hypothetical protein
MGDMPNVNRVKRSLFRSGELQECLTPTCSQGFEVPAVEVVGAVDGTQDGFEAGSSEGPEGVNGAGKNRPLELNPAGRPLTGADFQQQQAQEAQGVQGVSSSARTQAQQVNQGEAPYQGAFWRDSQDFSVQNAQNSARAASEPQPYEAAAEAAANDRALDVSGFQGPEDLSESERVEMAAQAQSAEMEARRYAELAELSFSLTGRRELRA